MGGGLYRLPFRFPPRDSSAVFSGFSTTRPVSEESPCFPLTPAMSVGFFEMEIWAKPAPVAALAL